MQQEYSRVEGLVKDNYAAYEIVENTTYRRTLTVPANRRWYVLSVMSTNNDDVSHDYDVTAGINPNRIQVSLLALNASVKDIVYEARNLVTSNYRHILCDFLMLPAGGQVWFQTLAKIGCTPGAIVRTSCPIIEVIV
jgi:hypothetical protein